MWVESGNSYPESQTLPNQTEARTPGGGDCEAQALTLPPNKVESISFIYQHRYYSSIPMYDILNCGASRKLGYPADLLRSEIAHMDALTLPSLIHRY